MASVDHAFYTTDYSIITTCNWLHSPPRRKGISFAPNCPEGLTHSHDRCFYFTCRLLWKTLGMNNFLACMLNLKGVPSCRKPFLWLIKFFYLFHDQPPRSVSRNFLFWEISDWLTATFAHCTLGSVPLKILTDTIYSLSLLPRWTCAFLRLRFLLALGEPTATFLWDTEINRICLAPWLWGIHCEVFFNESCTSICPLFLFWQGTSFASCFLLSLPSS